MRICYIAHSNCHFIKPYLDFFLAQNHEVHLISLHQNDFPGVVNHHPLRKDFDPTTARWMYFLIIPRIARLIRRIQPDIVHSHYATSCGLMAVASGFHPTIVTAHGSDINDSISSKLRRQLIRYVMKRSDIVNPVSHDLADKITSLGITSDKIFVTTLGIETEKFISVAHTPTSGPVRIICTRNIFPVYQCELIVQAARILVDRGVDFQLTFAGTGPDEPALNQHVQQAGLANRVKFLGGYKLEQLPQLLANADIYISSSLSDGTSLSLLEAMAAGTFPVVSDIAANHEWLVGNGDGLLFDVTSETQCADCLEQVIQDQNLRNDAVDRNRRLVLQKGDRNKNMEQLAQQYTQLVSRFKNLSV